MNRRGHGLSLQNGLVLASALWLMPACSADDAKMGDARGRAGTGSAGVSAGASGMHAGAGASGTSGTTATAGNGGLGAVAGTGAFAGTGSAGTGVGGIGDETLCNGIDDDGDGVIDDVDLGMDGVCDCLRVATIGSGGSAGQGNVFSAWLDERSTSGATDLGSSVLTASALEPFQVLVVQNVEGRSFSAEEVQAVEAWVRAGGGLMTLIGYSGPTEAGSVNTLLAPFGVMYGTQDVMQGGCPDGALPFLCERQSKSVTEWHGHPISMGVMQVGMDNGKPVLGSGTVVATGEGHTLASAVVADDGKVFVWGDEWITFDSEWTGRPEFQVELFWANALKWLTPPEECQVPPPAPPD